MFEGGKCPHLNRLPSTFPSHTGSVLGLLLSDEVLI
jgi:hypothetical protein